MLPKFAVVGLVGAGGPWFYQASVCTCIARYTIPVSSTFAFKQPQGRPRPAWLAPAMSHAILFCSRLALLSMYVCQHPTSQHPTLKGCGGTLDHFAGKVTSQPTYHQFHQTTAQFISHISPPRHRAAAGST